ncbi:MAG: hypothetical protein IKD08_06970 [Alphaproteobacteria bacterium]|nr:hypothetical protein [Alphaproteobacteria bacterium]
MAQQGVAPFDISGSLDLGSTSAAYGGTIGDSINYGSSEKFGLVKMLALIGGVALVVWIWRRK